MGSPKKSTKKVKTNKGISGLPLFDWAAKERARIEMQERLKKAKELAAKLEEQKKVANRITKKELFSRKTEFVSQLIHNIWLNTTPGAQRDREFIENIAESDKGLAEVYESLPESERYHADQLRHLFKDYGFCTIFSRINFGRGGSEITRLRVALAAYTSFIEKKKQFGFAETSLKVRAIYNWLEK